MGIGSLGHDIAVGIRAHRRAPLPFDAPLHNRPATYLGADIGVRRFPGRRSLTRDADPTGAPLGNKGNAFATVEWIELGLLLGAQPSEPLVLFGQTRRLADDLVGVRVPSRSDHPIDARPWSGAS